MDGPGSLPYGDDGNGCTWADLASPIYGGGGEVVDDGITVVDDGITCDFLLKLLRAGSMVGADAALLHELESRAAVVSLCRLRALGSKNRDDDPDGVASTSSLEDEAIREDVRTACVYVESLTKEFLRRQEMRFVDFDGLDLWNRDGCQKIFRVEKMFVSYLAM
ncbi:Os12g0129600 [Oryza sativa Japonica Group]|uniref:Os12g0129600 protein n=1 Tax=Oryza sativa subsp. japonica TaxID=39947 RepID=A0A0P0Y6I8_ORYSJ|nr:Os12g0129600 [Oryza sativa Japonica Group]